MADGSAADQQTRRLESLLHAIGETSPDLIYAKDRDGRLLYANPATAEVIGRPLADIIGRSEADWASNADEARVIREIDQRIMATGRREITEEVYTSPDGTRRVFRSAKSPMLGEAGEIVGIAGVSADVTAIRSSEIIAREDEERLRFGLDAANMIAWEIDLKTGAATRSADADRLFGAQATGRGAFLDRVHPDDRQRVSAAYAAAISGTADLDVEVRMILGEGRAIWAAIRGRLKRDAAAAPHTLTGVMMDITRRKEAELAAERAAGDFEALAENVSQLAWMAEPDGHIFWYNRRWYDFTGTDLEEMLGWGWQTVHHPDHIDAVVAKWQDHLGRGARWEDTFPLRGSDGVYRWFLSRAEPIRDEAGAIVRWFGTNTDVTGQIETAAALARSEGQFRTMAEALPGMLFVASEQDGNIYVNEGYRGFTGRSDEQLLGHGWVEALHPDDRKRVLTVWTEAARTRQLYLVETRFRRHDGAYRWHIARGLPVIDESGAVTSWVGACIDIHDRRMAEDELQRRVDQALAERETAMQQLHEAQKLETIGQLTGGVAHDFNNLLTPIVGSLDLLRRKIEDDRSARLIDGALASAERARTLIQRLLAFARRQTLQPRAVDPRALIEGMRDLIERSLGPSIEFAAEVQPGLPPALIDPNQLELALLNLSLNARDAMPTGGRLGWTVGEDVVVEGRADLAAGRYVRFSVADTGTGMDADTLARAVEPFFSTKPSGKGTGLGLSMVYGLAAQSGGAFRLESSPGAGTTAILWLPIADAEILPPARDADVRSAERRAVILLVDDEEQVRFITSESLAELGYEVVAAESAAEPLELVETGLVPDLLVTDHLMPGMNGAELAARLRRDRPELPILMITGYAQLRPEEVGGFDVLVKPYRHAELALRVAEILSGEPALERTPD